MLAGFLKVLCEELEMEAPLLNAQKVYPLRVAKELVSISDLDPGFGFHADICLCPSKRKEDLFIFLMRANLLGQGTGGARIGLSADEKFLTLSLGIPYEVDYRTFRDKIEEFVNQAIYWRDEVKKFEQEQGVF